PHPHRLAASSASDIRRGANHASVPVASSIKITKSASAKPGAHPDLTVFAALSHDKSARCKRSGHKTGQRKKEFPTARATDHAALESRSASADLKLSLQPPDRVEPLGDKQDPSHRLPALDVGVSGRGLGERKRAVDHDLEFSPRRFLHQALDHV